MKYPLLLELRNLVASAVAGSGARITTANGNIGGTTLLDAGLIGAGANSFVSMCAIIAPYNVLTIDSSDITAFNNATGEITLNKAFKGGQILAGTVYMISPYRFVPAEVAALVVLVTALMADVGDASGSVLGSLLAILGDPATDLATTLAAIKVITDGLLVTTETGGTLTTDGNVQTLYINDAPAGVFEPLVLLIDFTAHTAGETIELNLYYRIKSGGNMILKDTITYVGLVSPELINIALEPNRFGVLVQIQKTAGANRAYDWEVFYRG